MSTVVCSRIFTVTVCFRIFTVTRHANRSSYMYIGGGAASNTYTYMLSVVPTLVLAWRIKETIERVGCARSKGAVECVVEMCCFGDISCDVLVMTVD